MHKIFQLMGIKHSVTSAYHPQTNGQDEGTNQTFKRALSKYTNSEMNDWDSLIVFIILTHFL